MTRRSMLLLTLLLAPIATPELSQGAAAQGEPQLKTAPPSRVVELKASDGTVLKASYYAAASAGPAVLLFHQTNRTRSAWDGLAAQLASAGIHTLTLDMRGFGDSGGKPYTQSTDKESDESRAKWPGDIDVAWRFLISQPRVNRSVIGVGGAGYDGVDNAVQAAHRHASEVKSLALLSGETFLPGLRFLQQASQLPGLFVVADEDEYPPTVDAMKLLYSTSSSPSKKWVHYLGAKPPWKWYELYEIGRVPASGSHGTDLFGTHPELRGIIVDWFVTTLIKTVGHAPADLLAAAPIIRQLEASGGVAEVTRQLAGARRADPAAQLFPEVALDILGNDHLRAGEPQSAVEIFKLNLLAYPRSADAHADLADGYLATGQKELARQQAQAALALIDSGAPESSWSNSEPRRGQIRRSVLRVIKKVETPSP
jgi:hypothetical protein